ncbi:metallophosphoesterase [Pseudomonas sp. OV546]|uniref:metallophosphoesterase n=1 Tax=Pseudomonas sp. OV546 TaxID=1881063 RepID=UPI0008EAE309|nr:metallophosphoesterase [Pseudomonas sp. OV546]SFU95003.1 3',5'-cyclic AMP phosphodiesterase CpdA [Pseudomonas sp. OV546]
MSNCSAPKPLHLGLMFIGGTELPAIFIHLSDIHFGQEKNGGWVKTNADAKERLMDDVQAELVRRGSNASGIIVTGDIAYSAQPEQYAAAGLWLDELAARTGCDRLCTQLVPGNHDIDRDSITKAIGWKIQSIRDYGDDVLDMLLDDEAERESLFKRFAAYRDFAQGYGCDLDSFGEYSADHAVQLAPGRSIRFVRLNSALSCSKKDEPGALILGARQRVIPQVPGEEVVALMHHPLHWFMDTVEARKYIANRARVVISGHEHYPSIDVSTVEDGSDLMLLAAGAAAPDHIGEKYTYKYNILEFDWDQETDSLSVSINPRTWDDEHKRFHKDHEFLASTQEQHLLASPNFKQAPRAQSFHPTTAEAPKVIPVVNPISGAGRSEMDITARDRALRLKFFRDISKTQRLKILADLGGLPVGAGAKFDHALEQTFFARILSKGRAEELAIAIEKALSDAKTEGSK